MAQTPQKTKADTAQDYKQSIAELLDKYEDGWKIFKKATDWTDPVHIKEEYKDDPTLPDSWISLTDKVLGIIAHEKDGPET